MSRRAWLAGSVAGLATGCESIDRSIRSGPAPNTPTQAKPSRVPVIDAHVHLFAADESRFPFHPDAPYKPDYRSPVEAFLEHMDEAGIDGALLVHPEPYQSDHRYVLHCLERAPHRFRATCLFDPNSPETPAAMMRLCERPGFVALRIHAHRQDRLPAFESQALRDVWQTAGQLDLALQLHGVPRYLAAFRPLIEAFPQTPVIIDHLGRPGQGTGQEIEQVLHLAVLPNVHMKFSGLAHASRQPFPHRDLKPFLQGVVDLFGPQRMLWGDSYRGRPYGDAARAVDVVLDFVDEQGRRMISGGTAARLFRFS